MKLLSIIRAVILIAVASPAMAQGVQAPFYQSSEDLAKGHGWQLRARTLDALSFPVPTFQPLREGKPIAVDLQPLGPNPVESPGNGWSWFDACNADVMHDNTVPITCGRVAVMTINGAPAGYAGTLTYNDAPAGNFWLVTGTMPRWGVAYNGNFLPYADSAYSVGLPSNRATAVYAVNGTIQTSDEREKTGIEPTKLGLDFINGLKPVSYHWKEGKDKSAHQGVTAQNVLAAAKGEPSGVSGDSRLSLNYSELIGPLIKAVQELSAEVARLKDNHR